MKKSIIWADELYYDEKARNEYQNGQRECLEDNTYNVDEYEWADVVNGWRDDEKTNLDKDTDGVIIAFADLGFWNSRRQGYKIIGDNVSDIFRVHEDENTYFADGYNVRANLAHHDGTHYILYRVAKDMETAERICNKIYTGQMDEKGFRRATKSLYPYVADVYGWSKGRFVKA